MDHRGAGLALVVLLLAAPTAGATLEHLSVRDVDLDAGESTSIPLTFRGGPFEAGWAVVVNADVDGSGSLSADLVQSDRTVESWNVTPSKDTRHLHGAFAETNVARLDLAADGGPVNVTLYYDMSCECAGKQIPAAIDDGRTVFRIQVQDGATWQATFPEPPAHDLTVHLADRTDPASPWPDGFDVHQTSSEAPHEFTWTVDGSGDTYVWMFSETVHRDRLDEPDATLVAPTFHPVQGGAGAPSTPLGAAVAVAALAVAGLRSRKL